MFVEMIDHVSKLVESIRLMTDIDTILFSGYSGISMDHLNTAGSQGKYL